MTFLEIIQLILMAASVVIETVSIVISLDQKRSLQKVPPNSPDDHPKELGPEDPL